MGARLLLDDVERGVEGVLVGEGPRGVGRVDVEGNVVRREHGHARRRCHGSVRTRNGIFAPFNFKEFGISVVDSWRSIQTQEMNRKECTQPLRVAS